MKNNRDEDAAGKGPKRRAKNRMTATSKTRCDEESDSRASQKTILKRTSPKSLFQGIDIGDEEAVLCARGEAAEVLIEGDVEEVVGALATGQIHRTNYI